MAPWNTIQSHLFTDGIFFMYATIKAFSYVRGYNALAKGKYQPRFDSGRLSEG